jgi:hypothetical protein
MLGNAKIAGNGGGSSSAGGAGMAHDAGDAEHGQQYSCHPGPDIRIHCKIYYKEGIFAPARGNMFAGSWLTDIQFVVTSVLKYDLSRYS